MKRNSWMALLGGLAGVLAAGNSGGEIVIQGPVAPENIRMAPGLAVPPPKDAPEDKAAAVANPETDVLRFANGDVLHGALVSIDPAKGVVWRSPESRADLEFATRNLAQISLLRTNPVPATNQASLCLVRLTNGDELPGALRSLDGERLVLETWYAGVLHLHRNMVQSFRMAAKGLGVVFEGPAGMEGWTTGRRKGWEYTEGAFVTTRPASIGRDVKLPGLCRIELDLSWNGQLQFLIHLYTDGFEEYGNNAYMLQMNSGYVYLQRIRRNSGSRNLGQAEVPLLQQRNRAHLDILVNKEERMVALLVEGVLVKQWKDSAEFAGQGTGLLFHQQGINQTRLANLRVSEWDGRLEDRLGASPAKTKTDAVELINHDKLSGELQRIQEGKMAFTTSFASMEIPVERILAVELSSQKAAQAARNKDDIRAVFVERGAVTFELKKWAPAGVGGQSGNFGAVTFNPLAFRQITFNPASQKKEEPELLENPEEGEQ